MQKPNVLIFFSDQHRSCDLGCYGNTEVLTPNFDAFASRAARFTNCISNSPVCVPARGTLLTGLMPNHHRAITNDLPIDTRLESIATVMNRSGYQTGYIGKWHLGGIPRDKAIPRDERLGFTEWKVCNCGHSYMNAYYYDEENQRHTVDGYEPETQTDMALEFMRRNDRQPWGLVVSYGTPHDPYLQVPDRYLKLYSPEKITLRPNVVPVPPTTEMRGLDLDDIRLNYTGYYAHITALDEQFGRVFGFLEETGLLDNTIVAYVSDHGDMLGSQGYTYKQLPFFESVNIPLLVYFKGHTVAAVSSEVISLADLPVSLLALAGMAFSGSVDGQDCSVLFTQLGAKGADLAYIQDLVPCHQAYFRGSPEWRGVVTATHTFARNYDGDYAFLFDNINDPYQMDNLYEKELALRDSLYALTVEQTERYDGFLPWDVFILKYGYRELWNISQSAFELPLLQEKT